MPRLLCTWLPAIAPAPICDLAPAIEVGTLVYIAPTIAATIPDFTGNPALSTAVACGAIWYVYENVLSKSTVVLDK